MITLDEIKIIVKLTAGETGQNPMRAMITLDFGGIFKVKGFRIQASQFGHDNRGGVWVTPPSYFSKGKYHPIFYSESKEWWKKLELKILDTYDAACIDDVLKESAPDS